MKVRSILAACVMLTGSAPSVATDWNQEREQPFGPSYDCEKAQGALERTVCMDPLLSRLDLEVTTLYRDRLKESSVRDAYATALAPLLVPYHDELEEEQRQWLQARDDECDLDFDFQSGAGAHYDAVPCLIAFYAKRLVELDRRTSLDEGSGRRVLDVLVDVGIVALGNTKLDLGNVRIDLPRVLPVTGVWRSASTMPHPACIDALLREPIPSSLRRDACRAGTDHLPYGLDSFGENGDYTFYVPWHATNRQILLHTNQWSQSIGQSIGDRFGYRVVGELRDGRTLLHVTEEFTGAGQTHVDGSVAVAHGLRRGDVIMVERRIEENLSGFCGGGIHEVEFADADTLRLASTIPVDGLMTLFDSFPEQLHGVSALDRRRLRALKTSGAFDVAMSIVASTCIGRVRYDYDIDTGRRELTEVSVEVTESDRATIAQVPALACLFDLLLDRHSDMPAMLRPAELDGLVMDFIGTCEIPGT